MRPAAVSLLVALVAIAASCAYHPRKYPLTQHSQPFSSLDAGQAGTAPPVAGTVTGERIARARSEPQNWLTYYGAYDGQRFSALKQITAANVKRLKPAWVFQAGVIGLQPAPATYAMEAAPIVVDGVMYVTGWDGYVWALEAATGKLYWRYRASIPLDTPLCCGNHNRGVAVADGKVYLVTVHGHLLALDARNGSLVWDRQFADPRAGESATLAPLVVKNLVIVGSSGAEYGVRGHIDAFDLQTGAPRWRHYNVPKPGEAGAETWKSGGEAWARGGGTAWITGSYDPQLDLLYWSTGNPSPDFDAGARPGDNLYTNSVLALDPDDGALRWHYQFTPHDQWDYDGVNENILLDKDGRKLLAHFDKNGYLYVLDRRNGQLLHATRFWPGETTWGDVDRATGRVTVKRTPTPQGTEICPGPAGAKEWPHASYDPDTGLLYTPVVETCAVLKLIPQQFREGMAYWAGDAIIKPEHARGGHVKAFDPITGREAWSWKNRHPMMASMLSTAGGLLFTGLPTGEAVAFNARTGELLWQFQTGSGIHSSPITYSVDGRQYVTMLSGWGGWLEGFAPELYAGTRGSAVVTFALD